MTPMQTPEHFMVSHAHVQSSPKSQFVHESGHASGHHHQHYVHENGTHDIEPSSKQQFYSKNVDQKLSYAAQLQEKLKRTGIVHSTSAKDTEVATILSAQPLPYSSKSPKSKTPTNDMFAMHNRIKAEMNVSGGKTVSHSNSVAPKTEHMVISKYIQGRRLEDHNQSPEFDSTARRDSNQQASNYSESQQQQAEDLHNILVNFANIPKDNHRTIQRININNINNINTLNNSRDRKMAASQDLPLGGQYNEIIKLLNDKNSEIDRLSREKQELRTTLGNLANEIHNISKVRKIVKQKDQAIDQLQESLNEALMESQELRKELKRAHITEGSPPRLSNTQPYHHHENENLAALVDQLRRLNEEEQEEQKSIDKKSSLLELLKKQNNKTQVASKKPDSSYMLSNLEYRTERNSNPVNVVSPSQLFQRNYSTTLEDHIKRKLAESPYYENIRNNAKRISTPKALATKKPDTKPVGKKSAPSSTKNAKTSMTSLTFKRGELADTPRKKSGASTTQNLKIKNPVKADRNPHLVPRTTTPEFELTRRKFSHEPKLTTDSQFTMKIKGKDSHTGFGSLRDEGEQRIDISGALTQLKDRIKGVLDKHRSHHLKLKQMNEVILRKLEHLGISPYG